MFISVKSKDEDKDQESIQSSTTCDPDTICESDKNTRKHHIQESKEVSHFPVDDSKAARNRQDSITKTNMKINNKKDPQKKYLLGTVSKTLEDLNMFNGTNLTIYTNI